MSRQDFAELLVFRLVRAASFSLLNAGRSHHNGLISSFFFCGKEHVVDCSDAAMCSGLSLFRDYGMSHVWPARLNASWCLCLNRNHKYEFSLLLLLDAEVSCIDDVV